MKPHKDNPYVTDWESTELPELPTNAVELISETVKGRRTTMQLCGLGDVYDSERITCENGSQQFAVFSHAEIKMRNSISTDDNSTVVAFRPAIINSTAFYLCPDEGRADILHWFWQSRYPDKWSLTWLGVADTEKGGDTTYY